MANILTSIHVTNLLGLCVFLVLWIILHESAHIVVTLLRNETPIGWGVGPMGVKVMFMREPSTLYIVLDVLFPALISGCVLYTGLFTFLAPVVIPRTPLIEIPTIIIGVLLTSTIDGVNALRDLRYPLWGEARILRTIQLLRASWATIHFTTFGHSYVRDHFGSNTTDLLRAL